MKKLIPISLLLLLSLSAQAQQIKAPEVPVFGIAGPAGPFPFYNHGTLNLTDADYVMKYPDMSAEVIVVTGALTAQRTIVAPPDFGFAFTVENSTTGGFAIVFKSSGSGAGATIPAGTAATVMSDGVNYIVVGGTSTGGPGPGPGNSVASPFTVFNGTNQLIFTVPPTGNPTLSATSGVINISQLFAANLAGTGQRCLYADASGNILPATVNCGVVSTTPWSALTPGTLTNTATSQYFVGANTQVRPTTGGFIAADYLSTSTSPAAAYGIPALVANACLGTNSTANGLLWAACGAGPGGSGTVTSVGLTAPNFLTVNGSPIITSGTLALSLASQASTYVFAGPALSGAVTGSPTVVQSRSCTPGGNGTSPLTCTFLAPTTAGSLIIVAPQRWIPSSGAPAFAGTVTDNIGQTYLATPDYPFNPVAYVENTAAGVTSITTQYSNGGAIAIFEVSNIAQSGSFDADSYNVANLPGPPIQWEPVTTSNPSDFVLAYWTCGINSTTQPSSVPPWTVGGYVGASGNGWSVGWVWQNVASVGTYTPKVATADCTQFPSSPNAYAVAFKASLLASAAAPTFRPLQSNDLPPRPWSSMTNPSPNYLTQLDMNTSATIFNWNVTATNSGADWGFGLFINDNARADSTCYPAGSGSTEVELQCRSLLVIGSSHPGIEPVEFDSTAAPSSTGSPSGFHVSGATGDIVMQGSAGIMLPNSGQIISNGAITSDTGMSAPSFTVCTTANPCTTPNPNIAPAGSAPTISAFRGQRRAIILPAPGRNTPTTPVAGGPPATRAMSGEPLASKHLADFSTTIATNGQVPIWNSSLNKYVPGTVSGGGGSGNLPSTASLGSILGVNPANTWIACPPPATNGMVMAWNTSGCPTGQSIVAAGNSFVATLSTNTIQFRGGLDAGTNGITLGGVVIRGGDLNGTGSSTTNSTAGSVLLRGGNTPSTNTASTAGSIGMYGGAATGATTPGHQGFRQAGQYYTKNGTVTQWNLQQLTAAESTSDATSANLNTIGVAQNVGTSAVLVVDSGEVPVNAPGGVTINHTVCASGPTVGDSGGTGDCAPGTFLFGVVTRTTGTYPLPDGTSATLSSTLPAVKILALRGGGGATFPAAGIPLSTGTAWGTSFNTTTNQIPAGYISVLNQPTTGNAATATNLSTNGTANQAWAMNSAGTAQGWQTLGAALSALTPATTAHTISNGNNTQTWQFAFTGSATTYGLRLTESAISGNTQAAVLQADTLSGTFTSPFKALANGNGLWVDNGGVIRAVGTGLFSGPIQIPNMFNAPMLSTDSAGNIIAGTGNATTATALSTNGTSNQMWGMNTGGTTQGWRSLTYAQIGGTVPTWNQNTTGTAATASALSTSGAANQRWGMDSTGTTQGWQTPAAGELCFNNTPGTPQAGPASLINCTPSVPLVVGGLYRIEAWLHLVTTSGAAASTVQIMQGGMGGTVVCASNPGTAPTSSQTIDGVISCELRVTSSTTAASFAPTYSMMISTGTLTNRPAISSNSVTITTSGTPTIDVVVNPNGANSTWTANNILVYRVY